MNYIFELYFASKNRICDKTGIITLTIIDFLTLKDNYQRIKHLFKILILQKNFKILFK